MQTSSAAAATPPVAHPPASAWRGKDLGTITHDHRPGQGNPAETDFLIATGELFGLKHGFPTLDDAVLAARYASKGSRPAVAVLRGEDLNYHVRGVRNLSVWHDTGSRETGEAGAYQVEGRTFSPYRLEQHVSIAPGQPNPLRPGMGYPLRELVSIVDGTIVHSAHPDLADPIA